jgi:uroporphyrinogen-III decarboxylase
MLENLLNAAAGRGVGVYVRFSGFLQTSLQVVSESDLQAAILRHSNFNKLMDMFVKHQNRVMRALCDRFGRDLLFVSIKDNAILQASLVGDADVFEESILRRLEQICVPAREHGLPIALDSNGPLGPGLSRLQEIGIQIIQSARLNFGSMEDQIRHWPDGMTFIGGLSAGLVTNSAKNEIEDRVRQVCEIFKRQPGFILGLDDNINDLPGLQPQIVVTMIRAAHKYGQFGSFEKSLITSTPEPDDETNKFLRD